MDLSSAALMLLFLYFLVFEPIHVFMSRNNVV